MEHKHDTDSEERGHRFSFIQIGHLNEMRARPTHQVTLETVAIIALSSLAKLTLRLLSIVVFVSVPRLPKPYSHLPGVGNVLFLILFFFIAAKMLMRIMRRIFIDNVTSLLRQVNLQLIVLW